MVAFDDATITTFVLRAAVAVAAAVMTSCNARFGDKGSEKNNKHTQMFFIFFFSISDRLCDDVIEHSELNEYMTNDKQ